MEKAKTTTHPPQAIYNYSHTSSYSFTNISPDQFMAHFLLKSYSLFTKYFLTLNRYGGDNMLIDGDHQFSEYNVPQVIPTFNLITLTMTYHAGIRNTKNIHNYTGRISYSPHRHFYLISHNLLKSHPLF